MRGSLWKCSKLQLKLATTEESGGLEVQNQFLDDMKAEFQEFPGRRVYTDVEREGVQPKYVDRPSAAPRAVQEEEDRASALLPTVPLKTSSPRLFLRLTVRVNTVFEEYIKVRLQHHLLPRVFPVLSARIALIVKCHHYNAHSQQKQRNKYKRLKVIGDWKANKKTRKEIHLKSGLKEGH